MFRGLSSHDTIRAMLDRDGYVILEEMFFPSECEELVEVGLEFATQAIHAQERSVFSTVEPNPKQLRDKYFMESNDKVSFFYEDKAVGPDGNLIVDPAVALNKVGHALHLKHDMFRCYTYCDRVKSVCHKLGFIEPAVVQSMYIYKNPGVGGEVKPHQDATYLFTSPVPAVGFWIALEDATLDNGCLWIARGSNKSGVHRRLVRNPDPDSAEALIYDKPAPTYPESIFTPVPVSKGTCILLHGHVVHKSAANRSDAARPAYTFHVVEKRNNTYATNNWLQEGPGAPFKNMYETNQLDFNKSQ